MNTAIREEIEYKVLDCITKAENAFSRHSIPMIDIKYDLRGRCAGQYTRVNRSGLHKSVGLSYRSFRFNPVLLQENYEDYLENTVPHEVAHYITDLVYPHAKPHGREWKGVMESVLGVSATRCHKYDTTNSRVRTVRRVAYTCACGHEHNVTVNMHNKILRGSVRICKKCRTQIKRA